ncbi:hypothetical protein POM88_027729 [Heracleum sosnowskyi]|uniref:Uncharacterized protein n=1 Tax=Heracleum sosnowskyi TaxID=360622 RepID=A0AAD8MLQ7_9APIA|nr:hypothetical protein POM88_027729 [Heracleum sosnowskyi]
MIDARINDTNILSARNAVASGKRKSTEDKVGSSSKRVALELFPTHPSHDGKSLINSGHYDETNVQSVPLETPEDLFDKFLNSQYNTIRESCKKYLNNTYNDLVKQADNRASTICREKDMEMASMKNTISSLQQKLASTNEVINRKNTELDNSRRRNLELEEQVAHYNSQAEVWKEKAERAEEMLWNASVSPRRHACCCEDEEDTALSSVGETR